MNKNVVCEILNYNDPSTVIALVKQIQNYSIFDYILIVDNNSPDDSYEKLKKFFVKNKHIFVEKTERNGGYGYGNNYGVKFAKEKLNAKYVVISNPDVSFSNSMVEHLLHTMKKYNAALVSGKQKVNNKMIKNCAWKIPTALEWTLTETKLRKIVDSKFHYSERELSTPISRVECVNGAMFLIDVDKFLKSGGYDERMFLYCEETTLGFKLKKCGYKTYLLNSEFYNHKGSVSIKKTYSSPIQQDKITHRSKMIFMKYYLHLNNVELKLLNFVFKYVIIKRQVKEKLIKRIF